MSKSGRVCSTFSFVRIPSLATYWLLILCLSGCGGSSELRRLADALFEQGKPVQHCTVPVAKSVSASEIKGHQHIYFQPSSLGILTDPEVIVDEVILKAVVEGKNKGKKGEPAGEISISVNGLQTVSDDGKPVAVWETVGGESRVLIPMRKLKINGAKTLLAFALEVGGRGGEL